MSGGREVSASAPAFSNLPCAAVATSFSRLADPCATKEVRLQGPRVRDPSSCWVLGYPHEPHRGSQTVWGPLEAPSRPHRLSLGCLPAPSDFPQSPMSLVQRHVLFLSVPLALTQRASPRVLPGWNWRQLSSLFGAASASSTVYAPVFGAGAPGADADAVANGQQQPLY